MMFKSIRAYLRKRKLIKLIKENGRAIIMMQVEGKGVIPVVVFEGGYSKEPIYHSRYALNGRITPMAGSYRFDFSDEYTIARQNYRSTDGDDKTLTLLTGRGKCAYIHAKIGGIQRELEDKRTKQKALVYVTPGGENWYLRIDSNHGQSTGGINTHFNLYNHAGEVMTVYGHLIDQMQGRWLPDPEFVPRHEVGEGSGIPTVRVSVKHLDQEAKRATEHYLQNRPSASLTEIMLANISNHLNIPQPEYADKYQPDDEVNAYRRYLKSRIELFKANNPGIKNIEWFDTEGCESEHQYMLNLEQEIDQNLTQTH